MRAFNRGIQLEEQGKYQEALQAFQEDLQGEPNHAAAWAHMAAMLQHTERVPESLDAFDHALQIDPNDAYAWQGKARSLTILRAGREREALEACDRALAINPNLPNAHYYKGLALLTLDNTANNIEMGIREFRETLRLQPDHTLAMGDLAMALVLLVQTFDEAIHVASRLLQIDTQSIKGWQALAWGHFGKREYYPALQAIDRALSIDPNDGNSWTIKGGIVRELIVPERNVARADEAIAAFDRALAIDPTDEIAMAGKQEAIATRNQIRRRMAGNTVKSILRSLFG